MFSSFCWLIGLVEGPACQVATGSHALIHLRIACGWWAVGHFAGEASGWSVVYDVEGRSIVYCSLAEVACRRPR